MGSETPRAEATVSGAASADTSTWRNDATFMIYRYKVEPCPQTDEHVWTSCPYHHPKETARRRDPLQHQYRPKWCPHGRQMAASQASCPLGDSCPRAHNEWEIWLHPDKYHTELCSLGASCSRACCFFAHADEELRAPGPMALEVETADSADGAAAADGTADGARRQPAQRCPPRQTAGRAAAEVPPAAAPALPPSNHADSGPAAPPGLRVSPRGAASEASDHAVMLRALAALKLAHAPVPGRPPTRATSAPSTLAGWPPQESSSAPLTLLPQSLSGPCPTLRPASPPAPAPAVMSPLRHVPAGASPLQCTVPASPLLPASTWVQHQAVAAMLQPSAQPTALLLQQQQQQLLLQQMMPTQPCEAVPVARDDELTQLHMQLTWVRLQQNRLRDDLHSSAQLELLLVERVTALQQQAGMPGMHACVAASAAPGGGVGRPELQW